MPAKTLSEAPATTVGRLPHSAASQAPSGFPARPIPPPPITMAEATAGERLSVFTAW